MEINKEKPTRGNFVIRIEGKEDAPIIELIGMKRPFAALKALDMDDVGKQIVEALGSCDAGEDAKPAAGGEAGADAEAGAEE